MVYVVGKWTASANSVTFLRLSFASGHFLGMWANSRGTDGREIAGKDAVHSQMIRGGVVVALSEVVRILKLRFY